MKDMSFLLLKSSTSNQSGQKKGALHDERRPLCQQMHLLSDRVGLVQILAQYDHGREARDPYSRHGCDPNSLLHRHGCAYEREGVRGRVRAHENVQSLRARDRGHVSVCAHECARVRDFLPSLTPFSSDIGQATEFTGHPVKNYARFSTGQRQ